MVYLPVMRYTCAEEWKKYTVSPAKPSFFAFSLLSFLLPSTMVLVNVVLDVYVPTHAGRLGGIVKKDRL